MPSYEYRCLDCRRKFEIFLTYSEYGAKPVQCKYCHGEHTQRLISRVRFARSDESRLENLADPSNLDGLDDDPKALGKMMRQMSSQVGEDMGPEFNEVVHRLESGQDPEQIEKDMPQLGEAGGPGGGGDLDMGSPSPPDQGDDF
jgi:putative FmdB family regulatory protein